LITRLIFLLTLLSLSLVSYSSVTPFIEKNTLNDICKYSECSSELKEQYKKSYYTKRFFKAFAISYEINKKTNKYKIVSFGLSYEKSNSSSAISDAIIKCKNNTRGQIKINEYCQLLFVNNSITASTYENLTNAPGNGAAAITDEDECKRHLNEMSIDDFTDEQVCGYAKRVLENSCFIYAAINRGLSCEE
jgi:hypothetical protein